VISSSGSTFKLWDIATGREIRTFSGHSDLATSVAFSPDGRKIISGYSNGDVRVWNIGN
jgi:WD40 repeat protein